MAKPFTDEQRRKLEELEDDLNDVDSDEFDFIDL